MSMKRIEIIPKVEVDDKEALALVYTPGVGASCLEIKKNLETSFDYTNRENSVAVLAYSIGEALKRAIFLKSSLQIDAYPFEIDKIGFDKIRFIVENIAPSFCAIDLTPLNEPELAKIEFDVEIPVLKETVPDLKTFFLAVSKNMFLQDLDKLTGTTNEKSLQLRKMAGGVIETLLGEGDYIKPIAIVSDGSAVLGLGNLGAEAAMPVMEGKSVLFKSLGGVDALPLCIKTQNTQEIIELVQLLQNSFSGVNLEDICAPKCFEIEKKLVEGTNIPIFHDDQHGTAIVVLAGLLNALHLADKKIENVKIAISGAGAAAQAVTKLLLKAGASNIILCDTKGVVYSGRTTNNNALEEIAKLTNLTGLQGTLKDIVKNADVFIGLSAPGLIDEKMVKSMAQKPIIFALANPTPEIMPDIAKKAGAFIVATGRSDFPNQINNSLAFPGLFRGILDNNIKIITDEIKLKCALAIASLVKDEFLTPEFIIPDALSIEVSKTVAKNILTN